MDDATLKALKRSIEKWERNAVAETPEDFVTGAEACPLCELFWEGDCAGCPVAKSTGYIFCDGSPYGNASFARQRWLDDPSNANLRAAAHAAARAEVAFLRSLLPKVEEN